jgi:hypothetical protein
MKKARIVISMMVAFMLLFFSGIVFAQTDNENHAHLSSINQTIMSHAQALAMGEAKTKNDQVTHYNEARKALAEAKKTHNLLKKVLPEKAKSEAIIHHDNIDKYYAAATAHANSLLELLKNEKPDEAKLKENAKKFHDEISMAEKEHQELIRVSN